MLTAKFILAFASPARVLHAGSMTDTEDNKDVHRAWLTVFSDQLNRADLSRATGFPEPIANALGFVPKGLGLSLHSDRFVEPTCDMNLHLPWLMSEIRKNEKLCAFLKTPHAWAMLFLYLTTRDVAAYAGISPEILQFISELGCALQIKMEMAS